jgi:hypothetical protein
MLITVDTNIDAIANVEQFTEKAKMALLVRFELVIFFRCVHHDFSLKRWQVSVVVISDVLVLEFRSTHTAELSIVCNNNLAIF